MLELALLSIILCILPLFKYNSKWGCAFESKEYLFIIFGVMYLAFAAIFGFRYPSSLTGFALLAFTLYATSSTLWSTNPDESWKDAVKWWAFYGVFTLASCVPPKTALILSVIPIPFFLALGFLQEHGIEWDRQLRDHIRLQLEWRTGWTPEFNKVVGWWRGVKFPVFLGTIGNPNHTAAFLAPYVFISAYLAVNVSPWFALLLPPLLYGLYLTQCYAAWLGVCVGACFIYPPYSLIGLGAGGLAVLALLWFRWWDTALYERYFARKEYNFVSRFYYWRIAWNLWKKKRVFGWGIRAFRRELYEAQAEMNRKDPSLLGYKEKQEAQDSDRAPKYSPYPTRVHNDYLEVLCDLGVVGAALLLLFVLSMCVTAYLGGNYILLGGIVCLAVNGILFYTLSTFSYLPYIVLGAIATASPMVSLPIPLVVGLALLGVAVKLILTHIINPWVAQYWISKGNIESQKAQTAIQELVRKGNEAAFAMNQLKPDDPKRGIYQNEIAAINQKIEVMARQSLVNQDKAVNRAMSLAPTLGNVLSSAVNIKQQYDKWTALHILEMAIHHYDGIMQLPSLWARYGEGQANVGNLEGAKRALRYSIHLNPCLWQARKTLAAIEEQERQYMELSAKIREAGRK